MIKVSLILLGSLSLALGVIGIFVPGLPTTVFLLISAACYVRSSERLHRWLTNHRILGTFIRDYEQHRAMPLKSKVVALISMWTMICISSIWFIQSDLLRLVVVVLGLIGTGAILWVKTLNNRIINDRGAS
jgi:uncharacterized protein